MDSLPANDDSLTARFAQRLELRDNPPPPPPISHEPAAVLARIRGWLRAAHPHRQQRIIDNEAQVLLTLVAQPSASIRQLMPVLGMSERGTQRVVQVLAERGLLGYEAPGGKRAYRLTAATEDALLPVLRGEVAGDKTA